MQIWNRYLVKCVILQKQSNADNERLLGDLAKSDTGNLTVFKYLNDLKF